MRNFGRRVGFRARWDSQARSGRASEVLAWLWYVLPPTQYIIKPFCGGMTVLVGPETELPRNTLRKKLCAWSASVRLNATQSTSGGFRHYLLCGFMWFDATEICFGKTEIYFLHPSAASFACTTTDRTDRDVREGSLALLCVCAWRWLVSVVRHASCPTPPSSRHFIAWRLSSRYTAYITFVA